MQRVAFILSCLSVCVFFFLSPTTSDTLILWCFKILLKKQQGPYGLRIFVCPLKSVTLSTNDISISILEVRLFDRDISLKWAWFRG